MNLTFCIGKWPTPPFLQHRLDIFLDVFGRGGGRKAFDDRAVAVDEEIGEVPLDVALLRDTLADSLEKGGSSLGLEAVVLFGRGLLLHIFKNGFSVWSINLAFGHQREGDSVIEAAEFRNLPVRTRFLAGELVAREADNHQPLLLVLLIEGLQPVILRGETAFGSGADNHQDFAFKLREVHFFAVVGEGLELVNP